VASDLADEWVAATIQYLKKASPTSLKISLRSVSSRNHLKLALLAYHLSCVHLNIVVSLFVLLTWNSDKRRENSNCWGVLASGI